MPRRWDGDERGRGIADASWLVAGATDLLAALEESDWVAESRTSICARTSKPAWRGESGGIGAARAAVFSLIGSFAESASYVRQRRVAGDRATTLRFEVGTDELSPDARSAPHGHTVVINVAGAT